MISKDDKGDQKCHKRLQNRAYLEWCTNQSILLRLPDSTVLVGAARVSRSSERNGPRESTRHFQVLVHQGAMYPLEAPTAM